MTESKRPVVAAAIFDPACSEPTILCAQRAYPVALHGKWELPGGKAETGETFEEALLREISEELSTQIELQQAVLNPDTADGSWPILQGRVMYVWLASLRAGSASPQALADHLQLRWCVASEAAKLDWLAPNIPIMQAAFTLLAQRTQDFGGVS